MHKIGDYIVYKKEVCKVKDIKNIKGISYYILNPIDDKTLTITIPEKNSSIRKIITKQKSEELIEKIPNIEIIKIDDKLLENEYKNLFNSGKLEDLIKIIKTTYLRNSDRINNHKKIGEKDDNYFKKSEKLLYNEISISLGLNYDETKNYIKERVETLLNEK